MPVNTKILGKMSLSTLIVGALLLGGFRFMFPNTDPGLAPMTLIVVLAIIISLEPLAKLRKHTELSLA